MNVGLIKSQLQPNKGIWHSFTSAPMCTNPLNWEVKCEKGAPRSAHLGTWGFSTTSISKDKISDDVLYEGLFSASWSKEQETQILLDDSKFGRYLKPFDFNGNGDYHYHEMRLVWGNIRENVAVRVRGWLGSGGCEGAASIGNPHRRKATALAAASAAACAAAVAVVTWI